MPTRQKYTVPFHDGHSVTFEGPAGMSDADLVQRAKQERGFAGGEIPTSFAGGATRHLLEDEPGAVNALLSGAALATGVGEVPGVMTAIPSATSGLKHLSQFLATGHTDTPTLGGAVRDVGEGAIGEFGGPLIAKGARGVGLTKEAIKSASQGLPGWLRALGNISAKGVLLDAATSKPVLGAIERTGEGLSPTGIRSAFGNVIEGLTPGAQIGTEAVPAATQLAGEGRGLAETADRWRATRATKAGEDIGASWRTPEAAAASSADGPVSAAGYPRAGTTPAPPPPAAVPESEFPRWSQAPDPPPPNAFEELLNRAKADAPIVHADGTASAAGFPRVGTTPAPAAGPPSSLSALERAAHADGTVSEAGYPRVGTTPAPPPPEPVPESEFPRWSQAPDPPPSPAVAALERATHFDGTASEAGYPRWDTTAAADVPASQADAIAARQAAVAGDGATAAADDPALLEELAGLVDEAPAATRQQGARQSQFAQHTPEARAARQTAKTAREAPPPTPEQEAALAGLLDTPALRALRRAGQ